MRILVLSAWDPVRLSDGASLVLFHHLRHLADRHDVRVLTADREPSEAGASLPVTVGVERVPVRVPATLDGVARRAWALATGEPAHVRWVERPGLRRRADELVRAWRPDVVWCFGWGTARLGARMGDLPVVHTVVDPWGVNASVRDLRGWRSWFEAGETSRIARHEARHYPALTTVVTVADEDASTLRDTTGARTTTVPNGVDPGPEPVPPPDRPVVGFHGNLSARHNADAVAWCVDELLPHLRHHAPGAVLHVVGRDPPPEARAVAGLADVHVTGPVSDVRPELDRIGVYVAPLRIGAGMKNKVLEAMAAGRPVVSTPLGAQGIGAGDGLVVVPLDQVPDAVVDLLADPGRAAAIGAAGRARVAAAFTWAAAADRMEAVLCEALDG